jgi:hypothetical protein
LECLLLISTFSEFTIMDCMGREVSLCMEQSISSFGSLVAGLIMQNR